MAPNKEWMSLWNDQLTEKYKVGIQEFLNYAFRNTCEEDNILCPCIKCMNTSSGSREMVETHLVSGIVQNDTTWYYHGEKFGESSFDEEESSRSSSNDGIDGVLRDLYADMDRSGQEIGSTSRDNNAEEPNDAAKRFYNQLILVVRPQVSQVFYVIDNINKGWHVVVKMQPRYLYSTPQETEDEDNDAADLDEAYQHGESFNYVCGQTSSFDGNVQNIL